MALKMTVLVKQVPDTQDITTDLMTPDGRVNRRALPAIANPEDLNALEEAVRLRERYGGHVSVISMGPPGAAEALKECYYRGADDVILLTDKRFASADTLATSYALKCAVEKLGRPDLVFCGRQAIDGDTGQVGPQLAEKLGINQLTFVSEILEADDSPPGSVTVRRITEWGHEILKSAFPVLITITVDADTPRPPSVKRLLSNKNVGFRKTGDPPGEEEKDRFVEWDADAVEAEPERCGGDGSPTRVQKIEVIALTAGGVEQIPPTQEGIAALIGKLRKEHIIG